VSTLLTPDAQMQAALSGLIGDIGARHEIKPDDIAATWLAYDQRLTEAGAPAPARGAMHRGDVPIYPASVVKLFYMAAVEQWLEDGRLQLDANIERALANMIGVSSNEGTNYLIDLLTGTLSGPELGEAAFVEWAEKRNVVNRYIRSWRWPELKGVNVCQKTMDDDRYGRERQYAGAEGHNHNRLTTDGTARLIHEICTGQLIGAGRSRRMRDRMARDHRAEAWQADPLHQVGGFFGEGLPKDARLWSKCGRTLWTGHSPASWRRHDAAYVELASGKAFTLVVFTEGRKHAENDALLPDFARGIVELSA
jgi:beta-lactamase class A